MKSAQIAAALELAKAGYGYEDIEVMLGLSPRRGSGKWIKRMVLHDYQTKGMPALRGTADAAKE